jgi:hypothetical protein
MRHAFVLCSALILAGCGSLGTLDASKKQKADIADYDHVVVGEFTAGGDRIKAKPEEVEAGRRAFSEKIVEELRALNAFDSVEPGEASAMPALKISGTVDQWQPGNVAARTLVGFVGISEFDATVIFSDAATGEELGRLAVNRNSWPLPVGSASNVVQSVDFHMHQAAHRIAAELAKAKGVPPPPPVPEPEGASTR